MPWFTSRLLATADFSSPRQKRNCEGNFCPRSNISRRWLKIICTVQVQNRHFALCADFSITACEENDVLNKYNSDQGIIFKDGLLNQLLIVKCPRLGFLEFFSKTQLKRMKQPFLLLFFHSINVQVENSDRKCISS